MAEPICAHLDQVRVAPPAPEAIEGCEECLRDGTQWVHLRACLACGHIGCCDNSPERHATKHFQSTEHAVMSSVEPGEDWSWCFVEEKAFVLRFD